MAYSFVQAATNVAQAAAATVLFGSNVTQGNILIAIGVQNNVGNTPVYPPVDSLGNTFYQAPVSVTGAPTLDKVTIGFYWTVSRASGPCTAIYSSFSSTIVDFYVAEFNGPSDRFGIDNTPVFLRNGLAGTSWVGPTFQANYPSEIVIAYAYTTSASDTIGSPWTQISQGSFGDAWAYQLPQTAGLFPMTGTNATGPVTINVGICGFGQVQGPAPVHGSLSSAYGTR